MSTVNKFVGLVEFSPAFEPRPSITHVLFDFDGTLSLIRQGWPEVMVPMFVEMLPPLPNETHADRHRLAFEDIMRLTGKQTIYQMIQLAERIRERGGHPHDPLWYKHEYLRRLETRIRDRIAGLESGALKRDDFLVHEARPFLDELRRRGIHMYLASGTDEPFVKREAELLGLTQYFGRNIYGALDNYKEFSKKMVIDRILSEHSIAGDRLLSFGDGYVEIQNTKEAGGLAVAVASDEANNGSGRMDEWKRQRLLSVGTDVVIPDFRDAIPLLRVILGELELSSARSPTAREKPSTWTTPEPLNLGRLRIRPLASRKSLSKLEDVLVEPAENPQPLAEPILAAVEDCARRISAAVHAGAGVMLIYGAHLIKNGGQLLLVRMMDAGWLKHLATNGAGSIHDWEFAYLGRSTESVRENVATGTFGAWDETSRCLHLALLTCGINGEGYGAALGRFIYQDGCVVPSAEDLETQLRDAPAHPLAPARAELLTALRTHGIKSGPHLVAHRWRNASVLAQSFRNGVPLTVHPGIGYDIISNHPMFNGAAIGRAATVDFMRFAASVDTLDGGVVLSIGTSVMGPQVFEKAMSCVNNLRLQAGRPVVHGHAIYVIDLQDGGGWDWSKGEPPQNQPAYYLRFCKSYARMGGTMTYLQCHNVTFLHNLYCCLSGLAKQNPKQSKEPK